MGFSRLLPPYDGLLSPPHTCWLPPEHVPSQGAWAHGTLYQRLLFCEVGQSRAAFTSRYRLLYAPRIKPIAKGGSTDVAKNYQSHRHHAGYWRPLQLYDLLADPSEQVRASPHIAPSHGLP